ncbi:translation elongation factor [Metallosphaera tengchongensis]|uniref:Translation elongation factor n=1 Tax=Metallosphaera tengchongensis TaxID=1532350 RepID=A0A6N0NSF7_9CREN|nr:translation elongation factor [Metallosphaera tengchongensis]QKQ99773.1 translation elongation factor [Metallosphaera tengchongensis]
MYQGNIISVLTKDKDKSRNLAEKLGKLHEDGKVRIFYRRNGDYIRSVLTPSEYPEKILEAAEAASLSSKVFVHVGDELSWVDGEIALLATALGKQVFLVTELDEGKVRKVFKGTALETAEIVREPMDDEAKMKDKGLVYVDRVFVVKGVGVVLTGFALTDLKVHDKLISLPSGKEVEIKSIQVLDEDQEAVGAGVRVGLALRNVREDELKDSYLLIKTTVKTFKEFSAKGVIFPWSQVSEGQFHLVSNGSSIIGNIRTDGEIFRVTLNQPIPLLDRLVLLNVNTKPGKPRVVGYLETKIG